MTPAESAVIAELRKAVRVWTGREVIGEGIATRRHNAHLAGDYIAATLPGILDELERRSFVVTSADGLNDLLSSLNEAGENPVVVGFDANGYPFLAYGWAPGGDGWACGFVTDDTHSLEFEFSDGTRRCEECGAFERRDIEKMPYPVTVVRQGARP